jgi:hypothetical protein
MSDTSQGERWWLASDGKWYPPESATHLPPPPPPPPPSAPELEPTAPSLIAPNVPLPPDVATSVADIPDPTAPDPNRPIYKKPGVVLPIAAVVILAAVLAVVLLGTNKKPNTNSTGTRPATGFQPTTTTTDPTAAAAAAYVTAYNALGAAVNPGVVQQNSGDAATETTGINAQVAGYQAFDSALQAITWPSNAQSDAQAVLNADSALENALATLALNTGNVNNYNQVFDTVTPAENAQAAAVKALANDVGDTIGNSPSS